MILMMAIVFVIGLAIGMPVAFVIGLSAYIPVLLAETVPTFVVVQRVMFGMDSFPLLAIPFFILAGELMLEAGIAERLVRFAQVLVGHVRGGLAHVNVLASVFFAGISGSALADAAGLGKIEIRMMQKAGYDPEFSAAVTAASATVGPIIPPSILMVIYAVVEPKVSIGGLFMTGFVPGALMALAMMIVCHVAARRRNYPVSERIATLKEVVRATIDGFVALVMPAIILGGILGGVFTATEAGAVAVVYALVIGLFVLRTLKLAVLPELLVRTGVTTATVLLIIGMANAMSWLLATQQVPQTLAQLFTAWSREPWIFLLLVNICMLIVGTFMDITAAMLIFVPIFSPISFALGIEPLHFAIVIIVNLMIGTITPPLGTVVYVVSAVSGLSVERVFRAVTPFTLALIGALLVITYVPVLSLTLPRLMGYIR
jgi:C4-dicarboxylate transporter DctM subunit